MKKHRQLLALFICLVMSVSLLTGYSETKAATEEPTQSTEQDATQETAETREITDMAGRKVTVPTAENIKSVFSTGPVAAIFLYMVAPDKLLGWNYELNDVEKSIILDKYQDLSNFGMGDAVNYEAVIAANPTIAINSGKINDAMVSDCDALSESLGIPVVAVDNELNNSAEAFRFMGELLGVEDHAEELAQYAEQVFTDINALSDIPEEKKVSVYFGNGEDSLETAPRGSQHAQILDVINAVNVADLELGDGSRVQISAEQLLAWDPDVIVVNGEPKADKSGSSAAEDILSNPDYASLKAVQDQKVYGTPNAPFSWVDRPAGPNRLIGMRWFSALIYPEYIKCDINEEIHKFFDLFYHVDLSDEQLENVLKGTL
ncbi:Fe3+-hydroxamate ABC transporter substrate-binding protein [Ruminococcus sp. AM50-15BH]|jgi:iron complex transport system substrate-binding protein|uniref:ABC transporter substrate-binding protein n=1 Tax=Blautia wexlerae TaxID=418240 RepID=UPI000E552E1C|nr:ABC transporter substrate-binding protein [Blautia wexlerae]MCC2178986.1 ABC transporter substrate-binding protein [Blautia wexlerae]RHQ09662.1 Fe3+-hydroxamate ABC transporter substrate-binding protein [Ruminococcus sp. AM50-15BH]RHQ48250.1 Fe3+-hydroxamate ABC transporter substrate-binding protein [Ruminococcus sp. AF25-23LB]RHR25716.1 Fe3+-hydroxamate ABC transporter substrate-binding protein [Ruminococcus sp. AF19-29]